MAAGTETTKTDQGEILQLRREVAELRSMVLASSDKPSVQPTPNRTAILIGVAEHKSASLQNLRGPVNDVEALKAVLTTQLGVPRERITVLVNSAATSSGIQAVIERALGSLKADDTLLIYFSGHGSGTNIVPYDGDKPENWIDMSVYSLQIIRRHPKTLLIFDADVKPYALPQSGSEEAAILFASSPDEHARESSEENGKTFGLLTRALVQVLVSSPRILNLRDLTDAVSVYIASREPYQHPQLFAGPKPPTL